MRVLGLALTGLLVFSCSSSGDDEGPIDATVTDMGPVLDGGVAALCPMLEAPECMAAETCGEVFPRQSNCDGCFAYSRALCSFGECETPPLLESSNPINVRFSLTSVLVPRVMSFATAAIDAETAGGSTLDCEQFYAGDVDLTSGCYNIVDSGGFQAASVGQTYPVFFSKLPASRRALLLIWGYEQDVGSMMEPIGISCTEVDVGQPEGSGVDVEGDMMRLIQ